MQRDLVERARRGDHDAFAELAGAAISRLDSAAWLILRDPEQAGTPQIQEMLAPVDGSAPAIPIGPAYPVVNGSADLNQSFSPDGRTIVIIEGRDKLVRVVDATTGGLGREVSWLADDLPGWQRLAP